MRRIDDITDKYAGYYSFEFSGEPFEGAVIKTNPKETQVLFGIEGSGDEYKFRERLIKMDDWFSAAPYKVQQNHMRYVVKWLMGRDT